eukprot:6196214-Pleurochrysis_carterae.AAC.1
MVRVYLLIPTPIWWQLALGRVPDANKKSARPGRALLSPAFPRIWLGAFGMPSNGKLSGFIWVRC